MNTKEVLQFVALLKEAYPNFHLTPALMPYWQNALTTVEPADCQEAFRRYVYDSLPQYPPTLNRLLDLVDALRKARQIRRRTGPGTTEDTLQRLAKETDAVLAHGVVRAAAKDLPWAREHFAMYLAGVAKPGKAAEAVRWCTRMAQEYPADAVAWMREAQQYEHGWTLADLEPSRGPVPQMWQRAAADVPF